MNARSRHATAGVGAQNREGVDALWQGDEV